MPRRVQVSLLLPLEPLQSPVAPPGLHLPCQLRESKAAAPAMPYLWAWRPRWHWGLS